MGVSRASNALSGIEAIHDRHRYVHENEVEIIRLMHYMDMSIFM
jgi:hypothetical protein